MPGPNDLPRDRAAAVRAVVQSVDDTGVAQGITAQTHVGVVRSGIEVMSIHGLATNPGAGAEALLLAVENDQTHYVALPLSLFGYRFGALPGGGVALYDAAGNRLVFPSDGTGQLTTAGLMTMMVQSLLIQAQAGMEVRGPATFDNDVVIKGNLEVVGNLAVGGSITAGGAITPHVPLPSPPAPSPSGA